MARIGCDTEGRPRTEYRNRVRGKSSRKRRATSGRGPSRSLGTTRTRYRSTYIMVQSRILDQGRPGLTRGCIATELPSGLAGLGWLRSCGTVGGGMCEFLDAAYSGRVCWETGMAWRRTLLPARPGNRTTAACSSHLQTCSFRLGSLQLLWAHTRSEQWSDLFGVEWHRTAPETSRLLVPMAATAQSDGALE